MRQHTDKSKLTKLYQSLGKLQLSIGGSFKTSDGQVSPKFDHVALDERARTQFVDCDELHPAIPVRFAGILKFMIFADFTDWINWVGTQKHDFERGYNAPGASVDSCIVIQGNFQIFRSVFYI